MNLNQLYTNTNKTKQTRIVKHLEKYIAKRIFKYITPFGYNTIGNEIKYNTLSEAILKESQWLKEATKNVTL